MTEVPERVIENPSLDRLWEMSRVFSIPNNLNLPLFHSGIKSRSAQFTKNYLVTDPEARKYLSDAENFMKTHEMIKIDGRIGEGSDFSFRATLLVSSNYPQLALMFKTNLFETNGKEMDKVRIVTIPEYPERKVLVFPKERMELILGTDYYGESKMAALRLAMYIAREEHDTLGLHAGSKVYNIKKDDGIKSIGTLIFGLSGTGKTTLTCATHDLKEPESVEIVQDDINFMNSELSTWGSEKNFYVKTDSITSQPLMLEAVKKTGAILENVYVSKSGEIDFDNLSISTNGRAIVPRDMIPYHSSSYNVGKMNVVFFNTRREDLPPILKIETVQKAAAIFGLGESTVTSADDPTKEGQPIRTVGFNPFIIEDHAKEINSFKRFLEGKEFRSFVINTGWIGGRNGLKIKPQDTFDVVEAAIRGDIEFENDPVVGFGMPVKSKKFDFERFNPLNFYSKEEYAQRMEKLRDERKKTLESMGGVEQDIIDSI